MNITTDAEKAFMMPAISNSGVYRYVVLVDDGGM